MATPVIMPRQGQSVESCIITQWHKKKGDAVEVGDVVFAFETDKASFEEEAKVGGKVLDIFFEEGDDVPVLTTVCVIGEDGEDISGFAHPGKDDDSRPSGTNERTKTVVQTQTLPEESDYVYQIQPMEGRPISPRAKNLAERLGVDHQLAQPTGPHGRIIERDIYTLHASGPLTTPAAGQESFVRGNKVIGSGMGGRITTMDLASNTSITAVAPNEMGSQRVKLTPIRKKIAETMAHSMATIPQLTLNTTFDANEILAYRSKVKAHQEALMIENITINDMLLYTVSRTLLRHRSLNAHFLGEEMRLFDHVHLGIAIDTERGLMVPTIFDADRKSLAEIAREVKGLAEQCRQGTINPDLLQGGSFTVTNLGTLGIESFTPVINPPQTGILGVGAVTQRVMVSDGNEMINRSVINLSLTFNHQALDGAPAARFLQDLRMALENFTAFLSV